VKDFSVYCTEMMFVGIAGYEVESLVSEYVTKPEGFLSQHPILRVPIDMKIIASTKGANEPIELI
jgi:hypothetical protein